MISDEDEENKEVIDISVPTPSNTNIIDGDFDEMYNFDTSYDFDFWAESIYFIENVNTEVV